MEVTRHKIMDNAVQLFRRPDSPSWWCSCTVNGAQRRKTTGEESLARAKDVARDWYLTLLGKIVVAKIGQDAGPAAGGLKEIGRYLNDELNDVGRKRNSVRPEAKTFADAAEIWRKQYRLLTNGERSADYVDLMFGVLDRHVLPFFGPKLVTEIIRATTKEYLIQRTSPTTDAKGNVVIDKRTGQPWRPARTTLNQEMVVVRHVMETANGEGWLPSIPKLSFPYKASGKIGHRAWLTQDEYVALYTRTGERAKNPPHEFGRWKTENEDLHDYVLFMTNTGMRPDEGALIEPRDVEIVFDDDTGENILEIAVRGKRGTGWCKSMPGAVHPFKRIVERHKLGRTDKIFPKPFRELFTRVLNELGLKFDREGNRRTPYSLRHTYICLRLLDGADIYQVAKNCRTSVQMIQDHYAIHLKDMIDTAAVNRRKSKSSATKPKAKGNAAAKRAN
jgi:integrase